MTKSQPPHIPRRLDGVHGDPLSHSASVWDPSFLAESPFSDDRPQPFQHLFFMSVTPMTSRTTSPSPVIESGKS